MEALQILDLLTNPDIQSSWRRHPAVRMWAGYEAALAEYGLTMCREWMDRGYIDTCSDRILAIEPLDYPIREDERPPWWGCSDFHLSHQSMLIQKKPEHYRAFFPNVPDNLPYLWP